MSDAPQGSTRPRKKKPINTSATLAKILKAEGWTDHLANEIERYVHGSVTTERQNRQAERIEEAFGRDVVPKLSQGDRMVVGRFVSLKMSAGFEAGLRTGLGARIHQSERSPTPDEVYDALVGTFAGPSIARAIAKYHEKVFGGELSGDRDRPRGGAEAPARQRARGRALSMSRLPPSWPSGATVAELLRCVPADRWATTREVYEAHKHYGPARVAFSTVRKYLQDLYRNGRVDRDHVNHDYRWRRPRRSLLGENRE